MSRSTVPSEPLDPFGQIVGYARVSTTDQNLDRQTDRLTSVGVQRVSADAITGPTRDRPGLDAALNYLRTGDTLTVVSMDRLARSLRDLQTSYLSSRFRKFHKFLRINLLLWVGNDTDESDALRLQDVLRITVIRSVIPPKSIGNAPV